MPARKLVTPALILALFTASLAACGAEAQKNGDVGRHRTGASTTTGARSADDVLPPPATPVQLQKCQDDLKLQFAEAIAPPPVAQATDVALHDSTAAPRADAPAAAKPASTDDKHGKGVRGKAAPAAPPKTHYRQSTDPFFAVKMGWPVRTPALLPGAILPCHRIVAYYGNPFSRRMGVLGEYPYPDMIKRFQAAVAMWNAADPGHPVQPALQLISVVAQGAPGDDGMYRLRMPASLIDKVYGWARQEHALFIMDVQVGKSTVQAELPRLEPYLKNPDVMLAIDPEFSMHYQADGSKPGQKIGVMSAADINFASGLLEQIVQKYHLPPKILIVHRFTRRMVQNSRDIRLRPDVQIVVNMDGWGAEWLKRDSYHDYIIEEPVEYTGFKIFYHNDVRKAGWSLMTPAQVLQFRPYPLYIQYQ